MSKMIAGALTLALLVSSAIVHGTQNAGRESKMETTGIYDAAVYGNFAQVEALLKQAPELVNATDEYGFTPLHGVVGEHYFEMARLLIAKGAKVNARNKTGTTPLHLAAYPEMVEILVKNGADLEAKDSDGNTPLQSATEHPELIEVMEKLLQMGANANAVNNSGITPLDTAVHRDEEDKVEILEQYGASSGNAN